MKDATYKRYLLGLLLVISAFNFVDRLVMGLVSQSIKVDLSLSDTELGIMSGFAISLFYAIAGVPLARWADTGNRVTLIAITTALWSAAVAICGAARSFAQLLLIRVAVGVGHAGCLPTVNSLLPDYFNRPQRPRVMGIFALASPLGLALGYGVAGWIAQLYGWRATFVILALPGLGLALLAALTLREPRSALALSAAASGNGGEPSRFTGLVGISAALSRSIIGAMRAFATLSGSATFRHLVLALTVSAFFSDGIYQWVPSFFVRSYGMRYGELGTWLTVVNGGAALLGSYIGGDLMSRFAGHSERLQLKVMAAVWFVEAFISTGTYLTHSQYVAFGCMAVNALLDMAVGGSMLAIAQSIVPERMRAMGFAVVYLLTTLVGGGLGPSIGGVVSDLLHPMFGKESLRYALAVLTPGFLWSAYHLWLASKTVERDLAAALLHRDEPSSGQDVAVAVTPAH
jgi:MFS family permease